MKSGLRCSAGRPCDFTASAAERPVAITKDLAQYPGMPQDISEWLDARGLDKYTDGNDLYFPGDHRDWSTAPSRRIDRLGLSGLEFAWLLPVTAEPLQNPLHLLVAKDRRIARLGRNEILPAEGLDLDGQSQCTIEIPREADHPVVGEQAGRTALQCDEHGVGKHLRTKRGVVGTFQCRAAGHGNHVVECGNLPAQARHCRGVDGVDVDNRPCFGPRTVEILMHPPLGRGQELALVAGLQIHLDHVLRFHAIVGNPRGCQQVTIGDSLTDIA